MNGNGKSKNGHAARGDWRDLLIATAHGNPKALVANAIIALTLSPEWQGILAYDAFFERTMIRGKAPWSRTIEERAWTDHDDIRAAAWLQHQGIHVGKNVAGEAQEIAARDTCTFHPVIKFLEDAKWDGETHAIDEWAIKYLGVEDTDYVRAVSAKYLISAVARVYSPGCKADCALILEGKQGLKKSTALKTLFSPWFSDDLAELGSKDAVMQIAGVWCMEMAEMDSIKRGDVSRVKAFLSRPADHVRLPYGHRVTDRARQTVFAGTVNDNEYLRDDTGGRRFWPMSCTKIDIEALHAARQSLWAEARDRYFAGEAWWLDTDDLISAANIEQDTRRVEDPWHDRIANIIKNRDSITPAEILGELGHEVKDHSQLYQNRVATCLKILGWNRKITRHDGTPRRRYFPPEVATLATPATPQPIENTLV